MASFTKAGGAIPYMAAGATMSGIAITANHVHQGDGPFERIMASIQREHISVCVRPHDSIYGDSGLKCDLCRELRWPL